MAVGGEGTGDGVRLVDVEAWFASRGVPQLIEGYASEHRIDARARPWVTAWLVAGTALWWGVHPDGSVARDVIGVVGTLLLLAAALTVVRWLRGHPMWWADRRLETVDVFVLGLAVCLASSVVERSAGHGLQDGGRALAGLGAIYAIVGLGLVALCRWSLVRLVDEASRIIVLLGRTLPVLLILVLFLIFAAELWEAAHLLHADEVLALVALLGVLAATLVLSSFRTELHAMAGQTDDHLVQTAAGTPAAALSASGTGTVRVRLGALQRLNLAALVLVGQLIQSVFVAVLLSLTLVVFGLLALPLALQERWIGAAPAELVSLGELLGEPRVLTAELVTVSVLLGNAVGLYFTGLAVTDSAYRASHFGRLLEEVGVLVAAHSVYRAALTSNDPDGPAFAGDSRTGAHSDEDPVAAAGGDMVQGHERGRRGSLVIYVTVAYGLTWLLWLPPLLAALPRELPMPSPDRYAQLAAEGFTDGQHVVLTVCFALGAYGPALGALAATRQEHGSKGVRELVTWALNPRLSARWYLLAVGLALALSLVPALLAWMTGGLGRPLLDTGARLALFVPVLVLQLLTSGLGEEPGWRGYLLPRLQDRMSPVRAVWVLGVAWAVWHYPLTAVYAVGAVPDDAPAGTGVVTVIAALVSQTIGVIGLTYIYVWLFNRTGSLFLMVVFHALTNALPFLLPPALGAFTLVVGVFPWVVVLVLWLATRPGFLAGPRRGPRAASSTAADAPTPPAAASDGLVPPRG